MTHDELLARLSGPLPITMTLVGQNKVTDALRAVVELHKPWDGTRLSPEHGPNGPWCTHCEEVFDGSIKYPCPTIQAIEKELS